MSEPQTPSGPEPGWYPDPVTGVGHRWWDGSDWTDANFTEDSPVEQGTAPELDSMSDWMSAVLRIATKRSGHFFAMIVVLLVPIGLLQGLSVWLLLRTGGFSRDVNTGAIDDVTLDATASSYLLVIALALLGVLFWIYFLVAAAHQAATAEADPVPWSTSMQVGLKRLGRGLASSLPIVGAVIGIYLVFIIAILIAPPIGVLVFLAALVVIPWLFVRLALAQIGAGIGPSDTGGARLSWGLTSGRYWAIFVRMLVLLLCTMAFWTVSSVISTPFTAIAGGGSAVDPDATFIEFRDLIGSNVAIFLIGQLFGAIANGASAVVWATGLTLTYRSLSGPVDPELVPEPEPQTP